MPIPFTPPHVSVNRVQIVDLPGLPVDAEVRGQKAYHLLSSLAVTRYAREQARALKLPAVFVEDTMHTRLELPRFVDACLSSSDSTVQAAAESIGRRLGRNLGHILLTLHRGDGANRQARADWTADDWERWSKITHVRLGGGLVSGALGELIVQHARAFLAGVGYAEHPKITLSPHRQAMAIVGAGRYLPVDAGHALCFDFGQTSVKRARLSFEAGTLTGIRLYPALPVVWDVFELLDTRDVHTGRQMLDFVADAIAQTLAESKDGVDISSDLMLCVAAYVRGGCLLGNGLYAKISILADDARPLIAEAVRTRTGRSMQVHLIHDGTAASALHAGESNTAVIVIGTAMGVGFPPPDDAGLRPVAIRDADLRG